MGYPVNHKRPIDLPPVCRLVELLDYDKETGLLFWKPRNGCAKWNSRYAYKEAFTANRNGYKAGSIDGRIYQAHRVIWKLYYGADPFGQIDHINGQRSDNRIANLRDVSSQQNSRNRFPFSKTKSGHVGVCWKERSQRWAAYIFVDGRQQSLGYHKTKEAAIAARKMGEVAHGYRD